MSDKNLTFEEELAALEGALEKIKSPDTTLEEAIKIYEDGIKHYDSLNGILDNAVQKISEYKVKED